MGQECDALSSVVPAAGNEAAGNDPAQKDPHVYNAEWFQIMGRYGELKARCDPSDVYTEAVTALNNDENDAVSGYRDLAERFASWKKASDQMQGLEVTASPEIEADREGKIEEVVEEVHEIVEEVVGKVEETEAEKVPLIPADVLQNTQRDSKVSDEGETELV